MNILDHIIARKKIEVQERRSSKSISVLEKGPFFKNATLSFRDYLLRDDKTGIIAEFKRKIAIKRNN